MTIARTTQIATLFLQPLSRALQRATPLWWLLVRLWIASVFFKSGLTKIEDFDTTVYLFTDEYHVPLLSPYIAAVLATICELSAPVLLSVGLATRFAALPLLVMTAIIQFTYLDHVQHYYWALMLSGLVLHGAGKWSLDALLARRYFQEEQDTHKA